MLNVVFRLPSIVGLVLLACQLGGCGTINANLAAGMGDYIPQCAVGLPADAAPRPGTAKYDEFMQERERKRLEPKTKEKTEETTPPAKDAVR